MRREDYKEFIIEGYLWILMVNVFLVPLMGLSVISMINGDWHSSALIIILLPVYVTLMIIMVHSQIENHKEYKECKEEGA